LPAKTVADVLRGVTEVIESYRYIDPQAAFDTLLSLVAEAREEEERKPIAEAAKRLAEHNIHVWRRHGPAVQVMLVDRIKGLGEPERRASLPMLTKVLEATLGAELSGTTSTSGTVTLHRGSVVASPELLAMRRDATAQLKALYGMAQSDGERSLILSALRTATRPPMSSGYSQELVEMLMESAAELIEFEAAQAPGMSWELLQREESAVLRQARVNRGLPENLLKNPNVVALRDRVDAAVAAFRSAVDADAEYAIYKVLVGFDVVFPPAWEIEAFGYKDEQAFREQAIDAMIEGISATDGAVWHTRALRCAQTESNDLATFPTFNRFLERLGERRPTVLLGWLEPLDPMLARFIPPMLLGLQRSDRAADAMTRVRQWLENGQWLGEIAWFERHANPFDEQLLIATIDKALVMDDRDAIRTAMAVAGTRYATHPGQLIDRVFLPGLAYMHAAGDTSWVGRGFSSWIHGEIMAALSEDQAAQVLEALLRYPEIDHGAAYIIGAIARPWPGRVLTFLGERDALAASEERPDRYDAIPFSIGDELREPLALHPDLAVAETRSWYARNPRFFQYGGGHLVAALFPQVPSPLAEQLDILLAGSRDDISFVLAVLNSFEGIEQIEPFIRTAVARLELGDDLLDTAALALEQSGVVTGEFGYVELCQARLKRMQQWQQDENARVRSFADDQIQYLERRIAAETQRAEASIAAQHLEFGEDLEDG
jgi:hypothetical protein